MNCNSSKHFDPDEVNVDIYSSKSRNKLIEESSAGLPPTGVEVNPQHKRCGAFGVTCTNIISESIKGDPGSSRANVIIFASILHEIPV